MPDLTIDQAFQIAVEHHQAGRLSQAENLYRQILALQPQHVSALHYLGVIANQVGKNDIAVELIRRSIALQPDNAEAYCNLGTALRDNGQLDDAVAAYQQAISFRPNYSEAYNNLGTSLKESGHTTQAIAAWREAIKLNPNYPEAYSNLGAGLGSIDQFDEAAAASRQAIILNPNLPDAHCNLGVVLAAKGELENAIEAFRQAIALQPNYAQAYHNLANALRNTGQFDEAIKTYRQAISLNPNHHETHSNLIHAMLYHPDYDASAIAREQCNWNRRHAEPLKHFIQPHPNDRNPERRLRIGYVSADFRTHASAYFLIPLLEHHDPQQVEVFCYAQITQSDEITLRLQKRAAGWHNTVGLSDTQVTDQIRHDRIDILVDLKLHTRDNRLLVFARKPAPVQATWLGYPGSTGLQSIDYRLSDPYLDPPGEDESVYSERTIRLPDTFWCYDPLDARNIPVHAPPAATNGFVTFGYLNNFSKVNRTSLALWAAVLRQIKDSRLLLLTNQLNHIRQTTEYFSREEIDPKRLQFIPRQSPQKYAEQYHRIDVSLDSLPYNGHTTNFDSLWMGVPIVTLIGQTVVGRAGASILSNVGLPELIAHSEEEYVQIATDLAHDLPRLNNLRSTLRQRMANSPLMDAPRFARNIELAYRQMWQTWCDNPRRRGLE